MDVDDIRLTPGRIIYMIAVMLAIPAIILALSGDWLWLEGWAFCAWYILLSLSVVIYLYRRNPDLLAERFRRPGTGGEKEWDSYFLIAIALSYFAWVIVMPLDAKRFGWTPALPAWIKVLGALGLLASAFLLYRAFADNPFLSPLVRIQRERGQYVVSTGVYSFVRHPMYLGAVLMFLGAPMLLGSMYGFAIGVFMSLLLSARAVGEEKMLAEELEGYVDYQKKVRYRLIPRVW